MSYIDDALDTLDFEKGNWVYSRSFGRDLVLVLPLASDYIDVEVVNDKIDKVMFYGDNAEILMLAFVQQLVALLS